jgi:hypothetical protein
MEGVLGHDFSRVRVHTDGAAAESARAIDAAAYTLGRDIVFGGGRYAPHRDGGASLLAHELAHVLQQASSTATTDLGVMPSTDPLEHNARRVAARAEPARSAGRAVVQRQELGAQLPPVSLFPVPGLPHLSTPVLRPRLQPADYATLNRYLAQGGFAVGPGLVPLFNGRPTSLEDVVDGARTLVLSIIPREDVESVVQGRWGVLVWEALHSFRVPLPPPFVVPLTDIPAAPGSSVTASTDQMQLAAGGQWTIHLNRRAPADRSVQVTLQRGSGAVQDVYQFQYDLDTGTAQVMGGLQAQTDVLTVHILGATLKATIFVQLIAGITTGANGGSASLTIQAQAGAQVSVTIRGVQVAAQFAPSLTLQQGQPAAFDFNIAPQAGPDSMQGTLTPMLFGVTARFRGL